MAKVVYSEETLLAVLAKETGFHISPFVSDALSATPSVQPTVAASLSDDVRALLVPE